MIELSVPMTITGKRIADLVVTAFEGGSNYWIERVELVHPQDALLPKPGPISPWYALAEVYDAEFNIRIDVLEETTPVYLTRASAAAGFRRLAEQFESTHWADFLEENEDADTADVWLQLSLFGEVVFG
jgi:hypothetical protein